MSDETKTPAKKVVEKGTTKDKKTEPKKAEPKKSRKEKLKSFKNPYSLTDPLQQRFVRSVMKCGKKNVAERILKNTFEEIFVRGEKDPLKTFEKAMQNATPSMEVRPKRVGGAVYQIPLEVTQKRQGSLSIRWILAAARNRKGQPMFQRLAGELLDCASETGTAYNKKVEAHKAAAANKAFAHLARY